jgi:sporulation protein YlmC with PRC-barrel domain
MGPDFLSCAAVQGETVLNQRGEELGHIEQILLDVPSGEIAFAVLARGGVCGLGQKLYAIPWSHFSFDPRRRGFVLDSEVARIASVPGFDPDLWPARPDPKAGETSREAVASGS